jgi:vancomycin resistance protein YoaR
MAVVLKIDEATNSGPAHKNHTFSFSTKPGAPRDPKVVDAVKSLGNLNELTDKVYNRVMQLILHGRLAQKSEGELHSMLFNARHDAEERFAIKVALKAIDCRLPESKSNQKAMVAESTKPTITRAKNGSATINDVTFNAENLERIAKSFANKIASSAHDKEKNLWIVSPRAGRLVLKQQGTEARLELKKEQVTELLDLPDEEE